MKKINIIVVLFTMTLCLFACRNNFAHDEIGEYYKKKDGNYATNEWCLIGKDYYYFDSNGYLLKNAWTPDYYHVDKNGRMERNKWVETDGNYFYVNSEGKTTINEWIKDKGKWYYVNQAGLMLRNSYVNNEFYVGNDGAMIVNAVTPDGLNVDKNGKIINNNLQNNKNNSLTTDKIIERYDCILAKYKNNDVSTSINDSYLELNKKRGEFFVYFDANNNSKSIVSDYKGKYEINGDKLLMYDEKGDLTEGTINGNKVIFKDENVELEFVKSVITDIGKNKSDKLTTVNEMLLYSDVINEYDRSDRYYYSQASEEPIALRGKYKDYQLYDFDKDGIKELFFIFIYKSKSPLEMFNEKLNMDPLTIEDIYYIKNGKVEKYETGVQAIPPHINLYFPLDDGNILRYSTSYTYEELILFSNSDITKDKTTFYNKGQTIMRKSLGDDGNFNYETDTDISYRWYINKISTFGNENLIEN